MRRVSTDHLFCFTQSTGPRMYVSTHDGAAAVNCKTVTTQTSASVTFSIIIEFAGILAFEKAAHHRLKREC